MGYTPFCSVVPMGLLGLVYFLITGTDVPAYYHTAPPGLINISIGFGKIQTSIISHEEAISINPAGTNRQEGATNRENVPEGQI